MGFWIMLLSFICGLGLFIFGFDFKGKGTHFSGNLSKFGAVIGLILIGFAVYLAWPK
ncbi:hypothetical protein [Desemzia sp. FAM 23991]|uniref:hypothetical protein n=1 Tax=unclassified Desemzia TaxID=2685243 RepID=UPI00388AC363